MQDIDARICTEGEHSMFDNIPPFFDIFDVRHDSYGYPDDI